MIQKTSNFLVLMKNAIFAFFCLSATLFSPLSAQNNAYEYDEFIKQRIIEMEEFQNERDKAFASFLKENWEQYITVAGIEQPMPGPEKPIYYIPKKETHPTDSLTEKTPLSQSRPANSGLSSQKPKPALREKEREIVQSENWMCFSFYGGQYTVRKPEASIFLSNIEEVQIANAWGVLARTNYTDIINDCLRLKQELGLNDWGYVLLARSVGRLLSSTQSSDEITLAQTFILLQSDYKVRMARVNSQLRLLVATKQVLYSVPFVELDSNRYYIITDDRNESVTAIHSYAREFLPTAKHISMEMQTMPLFSERNNSNRSLIDFLKDYPQCDLSIYMNSEPSVRFREEIEPQFVKLISGKPIFEAISLLLHFIQTSFDYATDKQQFGYEKPFFVEENFFYPQNDCEDRSLLYAYLLKKLLQLDVILLQYPRHVSVGVHIDKAEVDGDWIDYDSKGYLICDPTYLNAPPGMCMPQHKNIVPIPINYKNKPINKY